VTFQVYAKTDVNYTGFGIYTIDATSWNGQTVSLSVIPEATNKYSLGAIQAAIDTNSYVWVKVPAVWDSSVGFKTTFNQGVTELSSISYQEAAPSTFIATETQSMRASFPGLSTSYSIQSAPFIDASGNVGIGTTAPSATLQVNSTYTSATNGLDSTQGFIWSNSTTFPTTSFASTDNRILTMAFDPSTGAPAIRVGYSAKLGFVGGGFYFSSGNVGIGTTSPQAKLDVNGNINISASGAGITFPNGGGTQTVAWTGTVCGGDYAESVDVSGDRTKYEPGDVLVIDPENPSKFLKSSYPYAETVAGVYSTKPGTVGRRQATPKSQDEIPMAVVGIVPVKVSAENGPIHAGNLLVTSSRLGYAMKGTDRSRMLGTVIGKAMGKLDSGTGVIEVLVTLQ
jgi:hypothetical protein